MSKILEKEISMEKQIQTEIWNFRKEHYHGEDNDSFWQAIFDETDRISKKYNSLYVDCMLAVCADDIETRFQISRGNDVNKLKHFDNIITMLRKKWE